MNLLIDGHNLIGSNLFPDIRLSDEDDEAKLVLRLKIWQSRVRGTMTVVFDRGILGGLDVKMGSSGVKVIFAADPTQADDLIRNRIHNAKQGLIVVTNDEALLREAFIYGVKSWRGAEFVERMRLKSPETAEPGTEIDVRLTKAEVEEWMALFRAHREAKKKAKLLKAAAEDAPGSAKSKTGKKSGKPPNRATDKTMKKPTSQRQEKRKGGGQSRKG